MSVNEDPTDVLLAARRRLIGPSLTLSYRQALHIVRGKRHLTISVTLGTEPKG